MRGAFSASSGRESEVNLVSVPVRLPRKGTTVEEKLLDTKKTTKTMTTIATTVSTELRAAMAPVLRPEGPATLFNTPPLEDELQALVSTSRAGREVELASIEGLLAIVAEEQDPGDIDKEVGRLTRLGSSLSEVLRNSGTVML